MNKDFCFPPTGTDVMLLDDFSVDGCSQQQQHGNLSGKRRSSVTFEDQVEHSKGSCHFLSFTTDKKGGVNVLLTEDLKNNSISTLFSTAENVNASSAQVHAEEHKSLDTFASCLAMAIESDAKLTLFGEGLALPGGLFVTRAVPRPRYLDGQRLRLESIDEGIVKDDRNEEEQDMEEKPVWKMRLVW